MPFFCPDLVVLQALKAELTFDPLAQLLVMVGELLRIPAFCRGEGDPEHLELVALPEPCLLYTSDAADERSSVDLGGRRILKKKK